MARAWTHAAARMDGEAAPTGIIKRAQATPIRSSRTGRLSRMGALPPARSANAGAPTRIALLTGRTYGNPVMSTGVRSWTWYR
jgi:hypothetical protein